MTIIARRCDNICLGRTWFRSMLQGFSIFVGGLSRQKTSFLMLHLLFLYCSGDYNVGNFRFEMCLSILYPQMVDNDALLLLVCTLQHPSHQWSNPQ